MIEYIKCLCNTDMLVLIIRVGLIIVIGFPLLWIGSAVVKKRVATYSGPASILTEHVLYYGGCLFLFFLVLNQLGVNIATLLGAAGIVGIAVGFAAQTGIANIISGIFLLLEHPFKISDTIEIDTISGKIETIDLLAIQLRTDDNRLVRIPNESLIKKNIINKTFFETRRLEFIISADKHQNAQVIFSMLHAIIHSQKLILKSPEPFMGFESLSPFLTYYIVRIWVRPDQIPQAISAFMAQCQQEFNEKQIPVYVVIKD